MGSLSREKARELRTCERMLGSPCCSRHRGKDLSYGDDFVVAGVGTHMEWARRQTEKSFLVKVIGGFWGDEQDVHELRVLKRVLSAKGDGLRLEADPRHQDILISELEQDVRGNSTPGVKNQQRKHGLGDGEETPLDKVEAHSFRYSAPVRTTSHWTDQIWHSQPRSCAEGY